MFLIEVFYFFFFLVIVCRAMVERSVPEGSKVTMSEQLQPVYETKNIVVETQRSVQALQASIKVRACVRVCVIEQLMLLLISVFIRTNSVPPPLRLPVARA